MGKMGNGFVKIAALSVFCTIAAYPVTLQQMTPAQMTSASTAIVRGTVSASYTALSGTTIFTHYTVQVSATWKGAAVTTADVALPGGKLNGLRQSFAGVPTLQIGQEYLLFLWRGSNGPTQLTGLTQGALAVQPDNNGSLVVSREATGEIMLDALGRTIGDQPVNMPLQTMHAAVSAALKGSGK